MPCSPSAGAAQSLDRNVDLPMGLHWLNRAREMLDDPRVNQLPAMLAAQMHRLMAGDLNSVQVGAAEWCTHDLRVSTAQDEVWACESNMTCCSS